MNTCYKVDYRFNSKVFFSTTKFFSLFLLIFLLMLLLTSCNTHTIINTNTPKLKQWTQLAKSNSLLPFPPRSNHSSVVFTKDGKKEILIIGGNGYTYFGDVWKSSDGSNWTDVTSDSNAKFTPRNGHSSIVLGNNIYVIGGLNTANTDLNNVWESSDGATWTGISNPSAQFPARNGHSSVVLGNDMYVIAGQAGPLGNTTYFNDVWKSSDAGLTWIEANDTGTKFPARSGHSSVVLGNDIYVIGGNNKDTLLNDVWKSDDTGVTWTKVNNTGTKFSARSGHSSVVLEGDIYVIGGSTTDNILNDVWKSSDKGVSWTKVSTGTKFSARTTHSAVVLESDIYIIAGSTESSLLNDVWKSSDKGVSWTLTTVQPETTLFPARSDHSSVTLKTDVYVIGGSGSGLLNDVWKSSDGIMWSEVISTGSPDTKFSARQDHSSVVLGNDIYVIAGSTTGNILNDVWKSSDAGLTWIEANDTGTKFPARSGHSSVVLGNDIYVIAGFGIGFLNDVWKSSDEGVNWTQVGNTGTKFSPRIEHSSVVLGSDIYVIGGSAKSGNNLTQLDDVWKSNDKGVNWTQVDTAVGSTDISVGEKFPARFSHSSVVLNNIIYIIGGAGIGELGSLNDIWKSDDAGLTWSEVVTTGTKFSVRYSHSSVVFNDEVLITGGIDNNFAPLNDVWISK